MQNYTTDIQSDVYWDGVNNHADGKSFGNTDLLEIAMELLGKSKNDFRIDARTIRALRNAKINKRRSRSMAVTEKDKEYGTSISIHR